MAQKLFPGVTAVAKKLRTGRSTRERDAATSVAAATKKQQLQEDARLAEATSDVATAQTTAKRGGRRSLIKTSPSGLASNLGGT